MSVQVASLHGVLSLRDGEFTRGISNAKNELQGVGTRLKNLGGQMQSFGGQMSIATAPLALGLAGMARSTQTFQRQMSNIQAITGDTNEATADLGQTLIQMGGTSIHGPQAVADAFYDIVSGVADSSTHMAILNSAMSTAAGGQADLKATTSALISTMNSYGFAAEDAGYVSDIFTRTVGMGVLTMDELASAMPQVTGLASQFNVGLDEAGGSLAYMTAQGFSASQSATFLRSMMSTLLNPTTQLAESITGLGYESGQALLESEGLVGAYRLLAEQNGGLAGLITNQEALTGSLVLTGDAAAGFLADYTAGIDGATEAAVAIQSQTEGWGLIRSQLEGIALTAGMAVAPAINDLLTNSIVPLVGEFANWAQANPEATKNLVLLMGAAVIAGPIIMLLGTIIGGVGMIISGVGSVIGLLTGGMGLLKGAALALLSPFGLVAAAIGGILAGAEALYPGGLGQMLVDASAAAMRLTAAFRVFLSGAVVWIKTKFDELLVTLQPVLTALRDIASFAERGINSGASIASSAAGIATSGASPGQIFEAAVNAVRFEFGGGRADGGPVSAGTPYIVGERGQELFVPSSSGSIVSNEDLQGMGGIRIGSITINANSASEGRAAMTGALDAVRDRQRVRGGW